MDKAISLANDIYNITCTYSPVGIEGDEEHEIELYETMIQEREPLVQSLIEVLKGLKSIPDELKSIIEKIKKKDSQDHIFFGTIRKTLEGDIKEVREGQKLNNAYHSYSQDWEGASSFDIKQ